MIRNVAFEVWECQCDRCGAVARIDNQHQFSTHKEAERARRFCGFGRCADELLCPPCVTAWEREVVEAGGHIGIFDGLDHEEID